MLVTVEADAMPGAVDEALAVSGFVDHAARRGVDRCRGRPRARRRIPRLLRTPHNVMDPTHLVVDVGTDVDAARDVGAVPLARSAEVEHDRVAGRDTANTRLVMGRRTVRAGRDDG